MISVTSIAQADVWPKVDFQYIESQFRDLNVAVTIVFICTMENQRQEGTWKRKGRVYHTIRLSYEKVKGMEDIRPMMLELAAKRLGVAIPNK